MIAATSSGNGPGGMKAIHGARRSPARPLDLALYLVTDRAACLGRNLLDVVAEAVRGGATVVQLREKACSTREFLELARAVKALLDPTGVPLIINDRVDVALAVGAHGVHVGQKDMPAALVRRLVGPDMIVGLSVSDLAQVAAAQNEPVDYLGAGPVYATPTKPDASAPMGLDMLRRARAVCALPMVAIGGIGAAQATDVAACGVEGLAVVSAVCSARDPERATRELRRLMRG